MEPLLPSVSDSASHGFQSQDGSIVTCALLSLVLNESSLIVGTDN